MDNIDGKPHYQAEIENCPSIPVQAGQCVGIVNIYAYLEVTGQLLVQKWNPAKNDYEYKIDDVSDKILPLKAQMKFKIIDNNSSINPSADWVARCCEPVRAIPSQKGRSQEDYTDVAQRQSIPIPLFFQISTFAQPTGAESYACCQIDIDFSWLKGTIPVAGSGSGSASGSASALGGLVTPSASGTASGSGGGVINGVTIPGHFTTKICWGESVPHCYLTLKGDVTDAKAVFDAGAIKSPWPR